MITDRGEEYLLLKALPEQVSSYWDKFAPLIAKSLPPMVTERRARMANVLRSVLMEELEVWVYYDSQDRLRYVTTTIIHKDPVTLVKDLLIYSFTSVDNTLQPKHVRHGFEVLRKYAKANDCNAIIAYTNNAGVKKFLNDNGADVSYNLAQMEV